MDAVIVLASETVFAAAAGQAGFDYYAIARRVRLYTFADGHDLARRFVPEHLRILRRELTHAPVQVPVQITPANADGSNPDGDLAVFRIGRLRHFAFFKGAPGD